MNIEQKFVELTSRTFPHGTEQDIFPLLPENLQTDEFGNKFLIIGENPSTMFTCHLDTASSRVVDIKHRFEGTYIKTDGTTILGADDKAGCVILLNMIENNIKGFYYFFLGEERGCIGSRKVSNKHKSKPLPFINKVVSFDRRGLDSVITHQLGGRCCSEEFANNLSKKLNLAEPSFNYKNDPTGIYTDSAQFTEIYPECTNISVGYYDEHTHHESQDIEHLKKLSEAVLFVDWESLPCVRDINKNTDYYDDEFYEFEDDIIFSGNNNLNTHRTTVYFIDPVYNYKSSITISKNSPKILDIDISPDRIDNEKEEIKDLFRSFDVDYESFEWDGNRLMITYNPTHSSTLYRQELSEYIDSMNFWKTETNYEDW